MFNYTLKKEALGVHEKAVKRYNESYEKMKDGCEKLYSARVYSIVHIEDVEALINSISHTPKEFEKKLGMIKQAVKTFRETEEYAKEARESAVKAGVGVVAGVAAGGAFASLAPTAAMSIATTFGTASTGRAISTLSGAAAKRAALAWLGGGALSAGGGGVAAGKALLAMAGPIGWGISAASTAVSLFSVSVKNKEISDKAIKEVKEVMKARAELMATTEKVENLRQETNLLCDRLIGFYKNAIQYRGMDYLSMRDEIQMLFGTLVNNTLSLAQLLNKTVE